jgi:hypothetical protein
MTARKDGRVALERDALEMSNFQMPESAECPSLPVIN